LIGDLTGAGVMKASTGAIVWSGFGITGAAIVLSALLGFFLALLLMLARRVDLRAFDAPRGRQHVQDSAAYIRGTLFVRSWW
jgi:Flp pilus assembly protein protease CpaA